MTCASSKIFARPKKEERKKESLERERKMIETNGKVEVKERCRYQRDVRKGIGQTLKCRTVRLIESSKPRATFLHRFIA